MLFADDFDDPAFGRFPAVSPRPENYELGYEAGRYAIRRVNPDWRRESWVSVPGTYEDATLAVDVQIGGDPVGQYVGLGCRQQTGEASHYRLVLHPARGEFKLVRRDAGAETVLSAWRSSSAIGRGNETNHVEMACAGSTVAISLNGVLVASVQDTTYSEGRLQIGLGRFANSQGTAEAWFDNLAVLTSPLATVPTGPQAERTPSTAYCRQFTRTQLEALFDPFRPHEALWQVVLIDLGTPWTSPLAQRLLRPNVPALPWVFIIHKALDGEPAEITHRFEQFCDFYIENLAVDNWSNIGRLAGQQASRQRELFDAVWCTHWRVTRGEAGSAFDPYLIYLAYHFIERPGFVQDLGFALGQAAYGERLGRGLGASWELSWISTLRSAPAC